MLWIEDEDCSNDNNGAYYCSTCNLSYDSEARFEEHVIKFHSEADDCFVTKTDIASDNSTPDPNLQCSSCNQSFNDIHTLNLHTRTWNGKCCDRSDSPAPDLPDVMQLTEEFICSKCGEEFTSESCLESHMSTQHSNSPDNVQEDLSLDEQLGFADFQHSALRQPCPICRRPFVSSKALKIHINKAHNESVTVRKPPPEQVSGIVRSHLGNTCDECGRRFPSLKQAKVHKFKAHIQPRKKREMMIRQQLELKKKTNQLPFFGTTPSQNNGSKCLDQERSRSHEHNIIRQSLNGNVSHDLNHRDSPSIQQVYSLKSGGFTNSNSPSFSKTLHRCRICSQWFSSFASLLSHRQIYHSQKTSSDYKANLNKAISNSSESISADSPNPNVEGLYTCHLCRKRFRAKTALRRHLFVHEHGKAFKCRQCGNSYTRLYSLKMHRRNCSKKMASIVATRPDNQHDQVIPSSSPQIISGPYMSIVQSANGGKAFRCRVCKRHFMNKKAVTSHLVKFHNLKGSGLTSTNPKLIDQSNPIHPMAEPVVSDNDEVKSLENNKPIEDTSDGFSCSFCNRVFTTPKGVTSHKVHMHYHLMKQEMKQHKSGANWTLQGLRNNHQHESGHLPSQNNRHLNQINHAVSHNKSNLPAFPLPNPNERSRFLNPPSSRSSGQQQPMPRPGGANSTAVRCPECRVLLPSQQFLDAHQKKFHASSSSILPSASINAVANHDATTKNLHPSSTTSQQKQAAVSRMSLTTNSNAQSRTIEAAAISKASNNNCVNSKDKLMTNSRSFTGEHSSSLGKSGFRFSGKLTLNSLKKDSIFNRHRPLLTNLRSKNGQFQCPSCPRMYPTRLSLASHLKSHYSHNNNNLKHYYSCKHCDRTFPTKFHLRDHTMRFCETLRQLRPGGRGETFRNNASSTLNHLINLTNEEEEEEEGAGMGQDAGNNSGQECLHCHEIFPNRALLEGHAKQTHCSSPDGVVDCFQCGRTFSSYMAFRIHMTRTHGAMGSGGPFDCPRCRQRFPTHYARTSHMKRCTARARLLNASNNLASLHRVSQLYSNSVNSFPSSTNSRMDSVISSSSSNVIFPTPVFQD